MPPASGKQKRLADEPKQTRQRVESVLVDLLPRCVDLSVEEMGWVTAFCFKFLAMKCGKATGSTDPELPSRKTPSEEIREMPLLPENSSRRAETLILHVIYDRPLDYPEHYVVRKWELDQPTERYTLHRSLEEARRAIPPDLTCIGRDEHDEPQIVETWI